MTASPELERCSLVSQFTDAFARKFYYLRLSVTDVCNFRCTYCLPEGYQPNGIRNKSFLSLDEIRRVTRAFAAAGTEKVRLTGGEPLYVVISPTLSPRLTKMLRFARLRSPPMATDWRAILSSGATRD